MDNPTFSALAKIQRPHGPVTLPGGSKINVRSLTLGELRKLDAEADLAPEDERGSRYVLLVAANALALPTGEKAIEFTKAADLDALADVFTVEQLKAIASAAAGNRADAKKD